MLKKSISFFFILSLTLTPSIGFGKNKKDNLDSLIKKEKASLESWLKEGEEDDLPIAYLRGDRKGVELYSTMAFDGRPNPLCQPLELDELIELSRGDPNREEVVLNISLPRVRKALTDACLVRPRDFVMAVGKGANQVLELKEFYVKKENPVCPADSPYSLRAKFKEKLLLKPLFYTTLINKEEEANSYQSYADLKKIDLTENQIDGLKRSVKFLDEFDVKVVQVTSTVSDGIVILEKKNITMDDIGLPHEIILTFKGNRFSELIIETVQTQKKSGHLRLEGILDYNLDGFLDILVEGDQDGCYYRVLFQGNLDSFEPHRLPTLPCSC